MVFDRLDGSPGIAVAEMTVSKPSVSSPTLNLIHLNGHVHLVASGRVCDSYTR
jgi:hypothetical protein